MTGGQGPVAGAEDLVPEEDSKMILDVIDGELTGHRPPLTGHVVASA